MGDCQAKIKRSSERQGKPMDRSPPSYIDDTENLNYSSSPSFSNNYLTVVNEKHLK